MAKRKWSRAEVEEYRKVNNSKYRYANKEDGNLFVRREYGYGWSFNWGNPNSYIISVLVGIYVVYNLFFSWR